MPAVGDEALTTLGALGGTDIGVGVISGVARVTGGLTSQSLVLAGGASLSHRRGVVVDCITTGASVTDGAELKVAPRGARTLVVAGSGDAGALVARTDRNSGRATSAGELKVPRTPGVTRTGVADGRVGGALNPHVTSRAGTGALDAIHSGRATRALLASIGCRGVGVVRTGDGAASDA